MTTMTKLSKVKEKAKEIIKKLNACGDVSEGEAEFMFHLLSGSMIRKYVYLPGKYFDPEYCEVLTSWYETAGRILKTSGAGNFITGISPRLTYFHGDLFFAALKTIRLMDPLDCPHFIYASQSFVDLSPEKDAFSSFLEKQNDQAPQAGMLRKFGVYETVKSFTSPKSNVGEAAIWAKTIERGTKRFFLTSAGRYEYHPDDCQAVAGYYLAVNQAPFVDLLYHDYELAGYDQMAFRILDTRRVFLSTKEVCKKVDDIMSVVRRKDLFNVCLDGSVDPDTPEFIKKVHDAAMLCLLEEEVKERAENEDAYLEFER